MVALHPTVRTIGVMALRDYFQPSDDRPPRGRSGLVFAVFVVSFFFLAWGMIVAAGSAQIPLLIPLLVGVFVVVFAWRLRFMLMPKVARDIQVAQLARLRERIPEAIELSRALLRRGLPPYYRAQVLALLGECAEMQGDFADAAVLLTRAEGTLRAARLNAVVRAQQLAVIAARRAFAHAACGELDRAESTLRAAGVRDGVPLAGPLSSRAMLLILARRGLTQQVNERLATDAKLLRNALAFRDRALVAVIAAFSTSRSLPHGAVHPDLARWVTSAFPESRPMLGVA
jgi:hypothetical protein